MSEPARAPAVGIGSRLGPYELVSKVGAGGMGEVWRAKDTRLDRSVAVKILPAEFAQDEERRARFEREAKAISSLNHPHICTLHDVGLESGVHFLVLELLEGQSLAQRLARGPLAIGEACEYGAQIAEALAAAHRRGIVHRDLKPGNVMLTKSGAKLLDFGLARSGDVGGPEPDGTALPTESAPLTSDRRIVGTFPYMAPEQVQCRAVDARTDVFALGAVLFEMVTGRRAFVADSPAGVLAAVLAAQPPRVASLRPGVPAAFEHAVAKCLEKDPDARWQSAQDVASELRWIGEAAAQAGAPDVVVSGRRMRERIAWALAAAAASLAAVAAAVVGFRAGRASHREAPMRFEVNPPPGTSFPSSWWGSPVVSPDGRWLAFAVQEPTGRRRLWLRPLDSLEARPLADTDDSVTPFWSPDSRSLAFIAKGALRAIDVSGGASRVVATPAGSGGAWSRDGVILFNPGAPGGYGPLHRVSAGGGPTEPATELDVARNETGHVFPRFLPDGRFLFLTLGKTTSDWHEFVGALGSTSRTPLPTLGFYAPPGYLLFAPPGRRALIAMEFDPAHPEVAGRRASVSSEALSAFGDTGFGWFSTSDSGVLAYRPSSSASTRFSWFDRSGRFAGDLAIEPGAQNPELSPDGRRLLFERLNPETQNRDVWVLELDRGVETRLSFAASMDESDPLWSADGRRIIWSKRGEGRTSFREIPAAGGDGRVLFDVTDEDTWTESASPDRRYLLFGKWTAGGQNDLMVLPLTGDTRAQPFVATPFTEMGGQFSPDGRFIAYSSDETGRSEIYVRPFPAAPGQWRVSTDGGKYPRWRADGRELFYIAPDRKLMSATVGLGVGAPSFSPPRSLFQTRISLSDWVRNNYAVSRDGQRFLVVTETGDSVSPPITVILNWPALLRDSRP